MRLIDSTWVVAILMIVGLVGIVVPVIPGLLLTVVATLVWALEHHDNRAWIVFGIALACYLAGVVLQYLVPGRRMRAQGIRTSTMLLAVVLGIVGFFVIPVVGAFVGFVLGIFLVERARRRDTSAAWQATKSALRAILHSLGIELAAGLAIATSLIVGMLTLGTN